jgi:ADP-ribose pyrophosphatase YjhB (NUDIX family)
MHTSFSGPVVAVGAVVWKGDRFLLIRRGKPPRQGSWTLPGGRQELGETVSQAAKREILEETGLTIHIVDLVTVVDLMDRDGPLIRHHYTVIDVVAEWVAGEAVAGDDAAAVHWADPADLDDFCLTDAVRRVVALAVDKRRNGVNALISQ